VTDIFQKGTRGYLKKPVIVEQASADVESLSVLPKDAVIEVFSVIPPAVLASLPPSNTLRVYKFLCPVSWADLIKVTYNPPTGRVI
jgi:hypothetical protein